MRSRWLNIGKVRFFAFLWTAAKQSKKGHAKSGEALTSRSYGNHFLGCKWKIPATTEIQKVHTMDAESSFCHNSEYHEERSLKTK